MISKQAKEAAREMNSVLGSDIWVEISEETYDLIDVMRRSGDHPNDLILRALKESYNGKNRRISRG